MDFLQFLPVNNPDSFDSCPENILYQRLITHIKPDVEITLQHPFTTICGKFRVDLVVEDKTSGKKVGFEVDGLQHLAIGNMIRDCWRDAAILGEDHLYAIYRILARDIFASDIKLDWFYFLSEWSYFLFEDTERQRVRSFASRQAQEYRYSPAWNGAYLPINYETDNEFNIDYDIEEPASYENKYPSGILRRHTLDSQPLLESYWIYIRLREGGKLENLINEWELYRRAGFDAGEILNMALDVPIEEVEVMPPDPRWDRAKMIPSQMLSFIQ